MTLSSIQKFGFPALVGVLVLWIYLPGFQGGYYGDDLFLVFSSPESMGLSHFFGSKAMHFFRPLDHAYVARVQSSMGLVTWPIHALALFYHITVSALTYTMGRLLGVHRVAAFVGAAFVALHQLGAYPVAGVDTLSQVGGTAWSMASLTALVMALRGRKRAGAPWLVAALIAFAVALLYKETSAAVLPLAGVLAAALQWPLNLFDDSITPPLSSTQGTPTRDRWCPALRTWAVAVIPFAALFAVYLVVRSHSVFAPVGFDNTERYSVHFGLNVPRNLAQFASGALITGSTVDAYLAAQARQWLHLSFLSFGTLCFGLLIVVGAWRSRRRNTLALLLLLALGSCFPAALLNRISELYIYNALPFIGLIVGVAVTTLGISLRPAARRGLVLAVAALALIHVEGARNKTALMVQRGIDAQALMQHIVPLLRAMPPSDTLEVRNAFSAPQYSVFVLPGAEVLRWGERGVERLAGETRGHLRIGDPVSSSGAANGAARSLVVHADGRITDAF